MKQSPFAFPFKEMDDLPKVRKSYNCDLPKVSKVAVTENFNLTKVSKMTKVTCPELIKVTNLLDFGVTSAI